MIRNFIQKLDLDLHTCFLNGGCHTPTRGWFPWISPSAAWTPWPTYRGCSCAICGWRRISCDPRWASRVAPSCWRPSWADQPWFHRGPLALPSGELTWQWKITIFFMGKSTISMAIFNCYVSSPEGNSLWHIMTNMERWSWPTIGLIVRVLVHLAFV